MECNFVRFRYGPTVQTVGLYPGLPADELSKILKTVLPVVGNIVGFQAEVNKPQNKFICLLIESTSKRMEPLFPYPSPADRLLYCRDRYLSFLLLRTPRKLFSKAADPLTSQASRPPPP
jgi:hypothetical protein